MTKKALVLGGNGLIARTVAKKLIDRYQLTIVDQKAPNHIKQATFIEADILEHGRLAQLIQSFEPDLIINGINLATIFSRLDQNGYPTIIAFYLNLYHSLEKLQKPFHYLQIGTTGAGGLGFHIPFTHGETVENLPIIHKAAFAGITTSLLTMLSRSFEKGIISEIKPGLAIFDEKIIEQDYDGHKLVALDGGESGWYTYHEASLLTSFMGFSTAQRVAEKIIAIIEDRKKTIIVSGHDIIDGINQTIISQDENDSASKKTLLEKMRKLEQKTIIATGNLGPPEITLDLILAAMITQSPHSTFSLDTTEIKATLWHIKRNNPDLYSFLKHRLNQKSYDDMQSYYSQQKTPWELVAAKFS